MALGYSRRCCSKTQKGTRCKLSNAFTGKFCHIHAPVEAEVEAPVAEPEAEEEYNPCSEKFSPQAHVSEPDSETEDEAPELEIDSDFETDPGVVLFKQAFSDAVFVEVPGQVPTLKLSDKGEAMMQSGEFYDRFVKILQK
jgi:hypothetical protein